MPGMTVVFLMLTAATKSSANCCSRGAAGAVGGFVWTK